MPLSLEIEENTLEYKFKKHNHLIGINNSPGPWPKGVWDPRGRCWCFRTYCLGLRVLSGGVWPRTLSGQSVSSDPWKSSKLLILHRFYKHFRLTPISLFALVLPLKSDFAAQGPSESDFVISRKYVILMFGEQCHCKTIKKTIGFISKISKRLLQ